MKKNIMWISGFAFFSLLMAVICVLLGNMGSRSLKEDTVAVSAEVERVLVVIDAGHGGEDGGCIAADNTLEKDLNLSISLKIYEILRLSGINTLLTREDDRMLYDKYSELSDYTGVKKTYDLKNRVAMAEKADARLFCSIHMNKFSDSRYSGFQVYYSDNFSESITAALRIQSRVREDLQPDNEREIKKADSSIYVLHRAKVPSVLCECGFLSNPEEREILKDEDYQKRLAFSVAMGIIEALSAMEGEN